MAELARNDARRVGRIPANLHTEMLVESGGRRDRQMVAVVDMSLLGVRIRLIGRLLRGQAVLLVPSERSSTVYHCQVRWVADLGIQFYSEAGLEILAMNTKAPGN